MIDYTALEDNQLQQLAAEGDRDAEEALAERYLRLVRACARPLFLAGGDNAAEGTTFRTYAEHCIRMRLLSAIKSASRLKHIPLNDGISLEQLSDDSGADLSAFPVGFLRNPEELVLARESKEELDAAFSRCLSRFEIKVLDLYLEGLSYREIAQRLSRDAKSVDNAVQRIRRKLERDTYFGDISIS